MKTTKIVYIQGEINMKKLLTFLLLLGFWANVTAGTVIDSEAVDFESESEYCKTLVVATCFGKNNTYPASKTFVFNPIQRGGTFEVVQDWYMVGNTFKFIPVFQYR